MRSPVSARVTGFDYSTFHAYTTEVAVDGRSWTLAIRYNTFFKFYSKLLEVEPHFKAPFPPKGGIFFSPLPEERQVQLDDFLQNTLTFYDLRGRPDPMGALVDDLLEISDHLKPDETPADEQQDAAEPDAEEEKQAVELPAADVEAPQTAKDEVVETVQPKEETAKPKAKEDGGFMSSLWGKAVSAAIQAVVVNTFQENVEAAKTAPKVDESAAPAKSLDSDFETPTSPVSRGSFSKTPRQSATVTPLVVPAASPASLKPEVPRQEPITVATVGVRDRIASWERAMSKSSSPSTSKPSSPTAGPRGAGRRSSSCSSAGDHAPIVPVGAADMPKLVKTEEEIAKQAKAEEEKTVSPVMTGEESVKPVETKEEVAEPMVETEEETVVPVVETPVVEEKAVVASESNEVAAEETSEEAEKEEADESEPAQTSTEDSAAVESSVEEATKVESVAKTPESVEEPVVVVDETAKEAVEVEADKEVAVEEPQPKEEAAESSQDAYDSDASDEIRQLKLEKIDLDERLRFYRQPVFFQGFYCRVHRMSVIEDDLRL